MDKKTDIFEWMGPLGFLKTGINLSFCNVSHVNTFVALLVWNILNLLKKGLLSFAYAFQDLLSQTLF